MAVANGISSDEKRLRRSYSKPKNMPPHYRRFSRKKLFNGIRRVSHAGRASWAERAESQVRQNMVKKSESF